MMIRHHKTILLLIIQDICTNVSGFSIGPPQTAVIGDTVRMMCTSDLPDAVDWHFYKSSGSNPEIISTRGIIVNGFSASFRLEISGGEYTLVIPYVSLNFSGMYECIEDNGFGPGRGQIKLSVAKRAFTVSSLQSVGVGETAVLKCTTGFDYPVDWVYYNAFGLPSIVSSGGKIVNGFNGQFQLNKTDEGEYNLIIPKARMNNSGTYECIENDGFGPGREKVNLTVTYRVSSSPQIVDVGDTAILTCLSEPGDQASWYFLSDLINVEKRRRFSRATSVMALSYGESKLTIGNVAMNDSGVYECRGNHGQNRAAVSLTVVENDFSIRQESNIGDTVQLPCSTNSNFDVEWLHCTGIGPLCNIVYDQNNIDEMYQNRFSINDTVDGSHTLVITNVSHSDSGDYICIDDQGFGSRLTDLELIIRDHSTTEYSDIIDTSTPDASPLSVGSIVGIVIGCLLALILIILLVCCRHQIMSLWKQWHKRKHVGHRKEVEIVSLDAADLDMNAPLARQNSAKLGIRVRCYDESEENCLKCVSQIPKEFDRLNGSTVESLKSVDGDVPKESASFIMGDSALAFPRRLPSVAV